jgi:hypothetical protein
MHHIQSGKTGSNAWLASIGHAPAPAAVARALLRRAVHVWCALARVSVTFELSLVKIARMLPMWQQGEDRLAGGRRGLVWNDDGKGHCRICGLLPPPSSSLLPPPSSPLLPPLRSSAASA